MPRTPPPPLVLAARSSRTRPDAGLRARALALGLLALLVAGCSTARTLEIATTPPGATIWVNGVRQAQTTPVTVPFTHYGYFDVRIEKPGYLPVGTRIAVETELDGYPFIDIPSEMTVPTKHFRRHVQLKRLPPRPDSQAAHTALDRARTFSAEARAESARGAPTDGPPGIPAGMPRPPAPGMLGR